MIEIKSRFFDWDEDKYKINLRNHKIDFHEAVTIFDDPNIIERYDEKHSLYEERFTAIGLSENMRILMVCHCYRESGDLIRIISARKATKGEIKIYGGV